MASKPRPLPPLQTLRAFEAAARLTSFTRAAHELSVTQGAISRQIRNLEERVGIELFHRAERGVALTPAGSRYHQAVREALDAIAAATADLGVYSGKGPVTIGASSALASLWLMPRLAAFRRNEPDLDIRVLASDHAFPGAADDVDLLITYARTAPGGDDVRYLFREVIFPVCAPDFLTDEPDVADAAGLLAETLLVLDDDHPDWIGWPGWFAGSGLGEPRPRRSIRINSYPMLLQAAVAGQGIALGWQHLVDDLLTAGSLVALPGLALHTEGAFYLRSLRTIPTDSPAGRLREWLATSAPAGSPEPTNATTAPTTQTR